MNAASPWQGRSRRGLESVLRLSGLPGHRQLSLQDGLWLRTQLAFAHNANTHEPESDGEYYLLDEPYYSPTESSDHVRVLSAALTSHLRGRSASQSTLIPQVNLGTRVDMTAGPGALCQLQSALDASWSLHDEVPSRVRMEVGIAASEIATNILEYSSVDSLRMELWVHPNEVHVEFIDSGDPVAIDLNSVRMPDEMAERGRGLALAQAVLRLLSYSRDELGNHWKLVSKAFSCDPHPVHALAYG
ncbi:MAG: ATP-binding protein [Mycobacterium sp.]